MRALVGVVLAAVLVTGGTGCASTDEPVDRPQAPASSGTPTDQTTTDQATEISVAVADGKVDPAPRRVEVPKDSQVRLIVTSDVDDELHVHGYEVEEELEAGRPTTVELTADQTGIFEVETHESELELLQLVVR